MLLDLLELEHMKEHHSRTLQLLSSRAQVPQSMKEWNDKQISIGFPGNSVWQSVTRDVQELPKRANAAIQEYARTVQRIEELEQELVTLKAKKKQWSPWQPTLKRVVRDSEAWLKTSQSLAQVESQLSSQAMKEYTHRALSEPSVNGSSSEPAISDDSWRVILRSTGFHEGSCQLMHDMDQTLYGKIEASSLSLEERLDLRYLKQMTMRNAVPFAHPFHERYQFNQRAPALIASSSVKVEDYHECVMCDCGTSAQLTNLFTEWKSPLARLDWKTHNINGPRLIMLKMKDLVEAFGLAPKECTTMMKAIMLCHKKHVNQLVKEEYE